MKYWELRVVEYSHVIADRVVGSRLYSRPTSSARLASNAKRLIRTHLACDAARAAVLWSELLDRAIKYYRKSNSKEVP